MISALMSEPMLQTLGWTLLHFVWQGALLALLLLAFLKSSTSAKARYIAACSTLALMAIVPVITFGISMPSAKHALDEGITIAPITAQTAVTPTPSSTVEQVSRSTGSFQIMANDRVQNLMPLLALFWLAGTLVFSMRSLGGWFQVKQLRRQGIPVNGALAQTFANLCSQLEIGRKVSLLKSTLVETPISAGWLKPVVIVPVSAMSGLTPAQLEAILLHELGHIRRHDYFINLIQHAIETLLFYHPAVWWVSRQIRVEREHCCDDLAVSFCGNALGYARALTEMEALRGSVPSLAMAANGGDLFKRVRRLVTGSTARKQPALASGMFIALGLTCLIGFQPLLAAFTPTPQRGKYYADKQTHQRSHRVNQHGQNIFNIEGEDWSLNVQYWGRIRLNREDTGVEAIMPNGTLEIREIKDGVSREIRIGGAGEALEVLYWVDSQPANPANAREWLRELLPYLAQQGLGARERATRIIEEQGTQALLSEISKIERNGVKSIYFQELLQYAGISDAERTETLSLAREEIESEGIYSDLLRQVTERFSQDDLLWESYIDNMLKIESNGILSDHIRGLVKKEYFTPSDGLAFAVEHIPSKGILADIMRTFAKHYPDDQQLRASVMTGIENLESQGITADLFRSFLKTGYIDLDTFLHLTQTHINSNGIVKDLLWNLIKSYPEDDVVFEKAIQTAEKVINSQGIRADLLRSLYKEGFLTPEETTVWARAWISSNGILADILRGMAQHGADASAPEFIEAVRSINSSGITSDLLANLTKMEALSGTTAIEIAMEEITSTGTMKNFLKKVAPHIEAEDRDAYLRAVDSLKPSYKDELRGLINR